MFLFNTQGLGKDFNGQDYDISQYPTNIEKNRFSNIYPCKLSRHIGINTLTVIE